MCCRILQPPRVSQFATSHWPQPNITECIEFTCLASQCLSPDYLPRERETRRICKAHQTRSANTSFFLFLPSFYLLMPIRRSTMSVEVF